MKINKCVIVLAVLGYSSFGNRVLAEENQSAQKSSTGSITMREYNDPSQPGNGGPLRIHSVTNITFGNQLISGDDQIYSAEFKEETNSDGDYVPDNLQIIDDRGSNKGWELQVKNDGFLSEDGLHLLKASELTINPVSIVSKSGNALPSELKKVVLGNDGFKALINAKKGEGIGTSTSFFGDPQVTESEKNHDITLSIPGDSIKVKDTAYQTTLTWLLLDDPSMVIAN